MSKRQANIPKGGKRCAHVYGDERPEKRGEQCKRNVKFGWNYCNLHGGANPASKAAAERAFAMARMPAIESLISIIEQFNDETCPTCNYPSGDEKTQRVVVRAAQVVLDRTGFGPHATLDVKTPATVVDLKHWLPAERDELRFHLKAIKELKARVAARVGPAMAAIAAQAAGLAAGEDSDAPSTLEKLQ